MPKDRASPSPRAIIILGMHRSGTSCLAGILEGAGVYFGDVSRSNIYNIKGNMENRRIMALHNDLLAYNQGAWDAPPPHVEWPGPLKKRRDEILLEYRQSRLWGFKDPRTLLALEGWLEALPDISFAATYRHPHFVAKSLSRRNGFSSGKSLSLWKAYNDKLLSYYQTFRFPVISFDLPETDYLDKIKNLLQLLELNPDNCSPEFYDHDLRDSAMQSLPEIPRDIMKVYENLNRIAL